MITLQEAFDLKIGDILLDSANKRWKVNGQVQTWKRNAARIRVPLKHGLYVYAYITEADFDSNGNCKLLTKEN